MGLLNLIRDVFSSPESKAERKKRRKAAKPVKRYAPDYAQLEDRVMFSASPLPVEVLPGGDADVFDGAVAVMEQPETPTPTAGGEFFVFPTGGLPESDDGMTENEDQLRHELMFIDRNVPDYEQLIEDLNSRGDPDVELEIWMVETDRDGVDQITSLLAGYDDLDAVHIVSHGTDGNVGLGNIWLNADTVGAYAGKIAG